MRRSQWIAYVGILSALAALLMFFSFPIPFIPDFLRLDLAELPALVGLFILGPWGAIAIEGLKNLIHLLSTRTFGIGEIANFIIGCSLILGVQLGIRRKWGLWLSLFSGVVLMTLFAALTNRFFLIPLYAWVLNFPLEVMISLGNKANSSIVDLTGLIVWGIIPFNLIKGLLVSSVAAVVAPRVTEWFKSK